MQYVKRERKKGKKKDFMAGYKLANRKIILFLKICGLERVVL